MQHMVSHAVATSKAAAILQPCTYSLVAAVAAAAVVVLLA
jgi:hypothetical protein